MHGMFGGQALVLLEGWPARARCTVEAAGKHKLIAKYRPLVQLFPELCHQEHTTATLVAVAVAVELHGAVQAVYRRSRAGAQLLCPQSLGLGGDTVRFSRSPIMKARTTLLRPWPACLLPACLLFIPWPV